MVEVIWRGGPVMIPLLVCSVLAVGVALERLWYLARTKENTDALMAEVKAALKEGRILEAMQLVRESSGPVSAVLAAGIAAYDREKDEVRARLNEVGEEQVFKMERWTGVLDLVVTIAPLLGLLGTVTGIIKSFRVLGAIQGIGQPAALTGGIAEALVTTAAGLIIAIPAMAMYSWISAVIDRRVREMNRRAAELADILEELAAVSARRREPELVR